MKNRGRTIWLAALAIVVALSLPARSPTRSSPTGLGTLGGSPEESEAARRETLVRDIAALLGRRREARDFSYVAEWPIEQLHRLHTWLALGMEFEGPWRSEELSEIVSLLDRFGTTYGAARFAQILETAVASRSVSSMRYLRIVRESGRTRPAAAWYAGSGRIVLKDGLWDPQYMREHHSWSFLTGDYANPGPDVTTRHVVIGHEFGHVIIDGMRAEAASAGHPGLSIEALYSASIPSAQWPHFTACTNEHMATEITAWALGITRTVEIDAFRAGILVPTAAGSLWPNTIALTHTPASTGR